MRSLPWPRTLLSLLLPLLLCCVTCRATNSKRIDFETFCNHGYFPGVLSDDKGSCDVKMPIDLALHHAAFFCKAQHYSGSMVTGTHSRSGPTDTKGKFTCRFVVKLVCPSGYDLIQSQCYKFNPGVNYENRKKVCAGRDPSFKLLERTTKMMMNIFAVHINTLEYMNMIVWMKQYNPGKNSTSTKTMLYTRTGYKRLGRDNILRGSITTEGLRDREVPGVICVADPEPTFDSLKNWCEQLKSVFRLPTEYVASKESCVYATYNHYVASSGTDVNSVKQLHNRCKLFTYRDYIPVDENFFKDADIKRLSFLQTGHPIRLAGSSIQAMDYHRPEQWRLYTSRGEQSNVNRLMWLRGKRPRTQSLTALGGAYTLALIKHNGELKYTDVPPYTELPVFCIATLNTEQSVQIGCNCPEPGICDAAMRCQCPPGFDDVHQKFRHKITKEVAPSGRICFACEQGLNRGHAIVIIFSRQEDLQTGEQVELVNKIYHQFVVTKGSQYGKPARVIILAHDVTPKLLYDSAQNFLTWNALKAHLLQTNGEGICRKDRKQKVSYADSKEILEMSSGSLTTCGMNSKVNAELSNYNMPYVAFTEAVALFGRFGFNREYAHVVYYTHQKLGPRQPFLAICYFYNIHKASCQNGRINGHNFMFYYPLKNRPGESYEHFEAWVRNVNVLEDCQEKIEWHDEKLRQQFNAMAQHVNNVYVVHAPENTPDARDTFETLAIDPANIFQYRANERNKKFDGVVMKIAGNICKPQTTYDMMREYEPSG